MRRLIGFTIGALLLSGGFFALGVYTDDLLPLASKPAAGTRSRPGAARPDRPPALAAQPAVTTPKAGSETQLQEALSGFSVLRDELTRVTFDAADVVKMLEALDMPAPPAPEESGPPDNDMPASPVLDERPAASGQAPAAPDGHDEEQSQTTTAGFAEGGQP